MVHSRPALVEALAPLLLVPGEGERHPAGGGELGSEEAVSLDFGCRVEPQHSPTGASMVARLASSPVAGSGRRYSWPSNDGVVDRPGSLQELGPRAAHLVSGSVAKRSTSWGKGILIAAASSSP